VQLAPAVVLLLFALFALLALHHPAIKWVQALLAYSILVPLIRIGVAYVLVEGRFRRGDFRCPCCGNSFTERRLWFPRLTVPSRCENCGYDIVTMHRAGDF